MIENEGVDALTLRQDTCLASGGQTAIAELLPSALSRSYGMALKEGEEGCQIRLSADSSLAGEEYALTVSNDSVSIVGGSGQGVLWGVQTLLQLAGPWAQSPEQIAG